MRAFVFLVFALSNNVIASPITPPLVDLEKIENISGEAYALGMMKITNCGALCNDDNVKSIIEASRRLWEIKGELPPMLNNRGYISVGGESGLKDKYFERKRGFSFGFEDGANVVNDKMEGINRWPENMSPKDKSKLTNAFEELSELSEQIGRSLLRGDKVGMTEKQIDKTLTGGRRISLARVFHYLGDDSESDLSESEKETTGSSPHTDWGFLTIVLELAEEADNNGGLEFYDESSKTWVHTSPQKSTVTVNLGDYLKAISGDKLNSPIHRVTLGKEDRTSIVFFYYPAYDSPMIQASSSSRDDIEYNTCHELEGAETKATATFGEWIAAKWKAVST